MIKVTASVEGEVIATFAWQHLKAAQTFRNETVRLELSNLSNEFGEYFVDIRSYCSATILSATAALEGHINELFIAPKGLLRPRIGNFDKDFWGKGGVESKAILKKYQIALQLLGENPLDERSLEYENARALIELRNSLVHYKPTWNKSEHKRVVVDSLISGKFPLSPFLDEGADLVTKKCMSAGCAKWAFASAIQFLRTFHSRFSFSGLKMSNFWKLDT